MFLEVLVTLHDLRRRRPLVEVSALDLLDRLRSLEVHRLALGASLAVDLRGGDADVPERLAAATLEERLALVGELTELAQRRQVPQRREAKKLEELRSRPVDQRPACLFLLAEDLEQPALEQDLQR